MTSPAPPPSIPFGGPNVQEIPQIGPPQPGGNQIPHQLPEAPADFLKERAIERRTKMREQSLHLYEWAPAEARRKGVVVDLDMDKMQVDFTSAMVDQRDQGEVEPPTDRGKWRIMEGSQDVVREGFRVTNKLVKWNRQVSLRTIACKYRVTVLMQGSVDFTIVLRSKNLTNSETTYITFVKDVSATEQRLWVNVSYLDTKRMAFYQTKTTEIQMGEDRSTKYAKIPFQVEASIIDNGDDQMALRVYLQGNQNRMTYVTFKDLLTPIYDEVSCFVYARQRLPVGPDGNEIFLKFFHVEQIDRVESFDMQQEVVKAPPKNECCIII